MKNKMLFESFLLISIFFISIGATSCTTGQQDTATVEADLITVLNPAISSKMTERVPLAPRSDTLEGKTLYLVDMQWGGPKAAYSVFEEMKEWFSKNIPSVNVEIKRTINGWMGDDAALRKEIIDKKPAGVLIGIGG